MHLARLEQIRLVDGIEHQALTGSRETRIARSFLQRLVDRSGCVICRDHLQSPGFPIITV